MGKKNFFLSKSKFTPKMIKTIAFMFLCLSIVQSTACRRHIKQDLKTIQKHNKDNFKITNVPNEIMTFEKWEKMVHEKPEIIDLNKKTYAPKSKKGSTVRKERLIKKTLV